MYTDIICIDDDPITLLLSRKVLSKMEVSAHIHTFDSCIEALQFIQQNAANPNFKTLILLDLNMPVMGGWEFLDAFMELSISKVSSWFEVVILSSTIDPNDVERTQLYPIVRSFLSKPITKDMMRHLLSIPD